MLFIPLAVIKISKAYFGVGFLILLFLVIYPVLSMGIGTVAGTEIRKLWWLPLAIAIPFPLLFAVAIAEIVWELYIYSAIYLLLASLFMGMTAFFRRIMTKKSEK